MKYWIVLFSLLLSAQALASPTSVIPLNQNLAVVDYFGEGRQTGCGVRATGETKDNLWLNVLITVFLKETGSTFGVIKVVARKQRTVFLCSKMAKLPTPIWEKFRKPGSNQTRGKSR
jgi:hypothetical protein